MRRSKGNPAISGQVLACGGTAFVAISASRGLTRGNGRQTTSSPRPSEALGLNRKRKPKGLRQSCQDTGLGRWRSKRGTALCLLVEVKEGTLSLSNEQGQS